MKPTWITFKVPITHPSRVLKATPLKDTRYLLSPTYVSLITGNVILHEKQGSDWLPNLTTNPSYRQYMKVMRLKSGGHLGIRNAYFAEADVGAESQLTIPHVHLHVLPPWV